MLAARSLSVVLMLLTLGLAAALSVPASHAGTVQPLAPVTEVDGRLGLDNILPGSPPGSTATWAQLAVSAGARVDRWELRWDRIEPHPGVWNFALDDPAVSSPAAAGIDVLGILIGTPGWAAAPGQKPGNGLPKGLSKPIDAPGNTWATYVRATVTHYQGQIHSWEIWNEPDLPFFWSGSAADYVQLASVAYQVIKSVDPHATVVLAGMVVPDLRFLTQVLALAQTSGHRVFDVVAWHAYGAAKSLYQNLLAVRSAMRTHGFSHIPIWVTESGFPAADPAGEPRQAAYVVQSTVFALLAGAERVYVYRASDDTTAKQWGLMTASGQARMGYVAFQVASRYLAGSTDLVYAPTPRQERVVAYGPQRTVVVAWSKTTSPATLDLPATDTLQAVDWQGNLSVPVQAGSVDHILLAGATYNSGGVDPGSTVVGGPPTFAVENVSATSAATVQDVMTVAPDANARLLLLNPGSTALPIVVQSLARPDRQIQVLLGASGLVHVDPRLISGVHGSGPYLIRSSAPLVTTVTGSPPESSPMATSNRWYLLHVTGTVDITNPSDATLRLRLRAYSASGHSRAVGAYDVPGRSTTTLNIQGAQGSSVALVARIPFAIGSSSGAVTETRVLWDLVHPEHGQIRLFNPSAKPAVLDLRFLGAPTVKAEHVYLAAHHSFLAHAHGGRVVLVSSSVPVAASSGPESPQPTTTSAIALVAPSRLALFNPALLTAHVLLRIVHGANSKMLTETIAPLHVATSIRGASGGTAVVIQSDVPVVAVRER